MAALEARLDQSHEVAGRAPTPTADGEPDHPAHSPRVASLVLVVVAAMLAAPLAGWLSAAAVATAATATALVPVVVVDVREGRIPTRMVHVAAVTVVATLMLAALVHGHWGRLAVAAASAAAAVLLLTLGWLAGGLGFGDVRLAGLVSLTAGWHGVAVVLAMWWWTAVAVFVVALVARVRRRRSVPLAPALAAGWVIALVGVA